MVSVMKSPNMMSTTGRSPVMAAPTATPVKPASEIGVSTTRAAPNSSTNPDRTLKGVPASATSSPKMHTRESRRISSASASRTACANVSSRSGIYVLVYFVDARIRRRDRELHGCFHLSAHLGRNTFQRCGDGMAFLHQPARVQLDRIPLSLPLLLFYFGAVVLAIDVADVMSAVTVGVALQERWSAAGPRPLDQARRDFVHRADILPIDAGRFDAEGGGAAENGSRGRFRVVRVLVVEIVFADVDHGQLPQLRQVHHFIERSLPERAFAEKADCYAVRFQMLRSEGRAGGDSHAATHDRVRAQVASCGIGNVHGPAFAAAITSFLA